MAKNKKVMSLAIDPVLHNQLKEYTERKDVSTSAYLGDLITKAIKIPVDDDPIILGKPVDQQILPVILKIPASLKGKKEDLTKWLAEQTGRLIAKLG